MKTKRLSVHNEMRGFVEVSHGEYNHEKWCSACARQTAGTATLVVCSNGYQSTTLQFCRPCREIVRTLFDHADREFP
jgi:hypothetical protein